MLPRRHACARFVNSTGRTLKRSWTAVRNPPAPQFCWTQPAVQTGVTSFFNRSLYCNGTRRQQKQTVTCYWACAPAAEIFVRNTGVPKHRWGNYCPKFQFYYTDVFPERWGCSPHTYAQTLASLQMTPCSSPRVHFSSKHVLKVWRLSAVGTTYFRGTSSQGGTNKKTCVRITLLS